MDQKGCTGKSFLEALESLGSCWCPGLRHGPILEEISQWTGDGAEVLDEMVGGPSLRAGGVRLYSGNTQCHQCRLVRIGGGSPGVHEVLEYGGGVDQTIRHDEILIVPCSSHKGSLPLVPLTYPDETVGTAEVQLVEHGRST